MIIKTVASYCASWSGSMCHGDRSSAIMVLTAFTLDVIYIMMQCRCDIDAPNRLRREKQKLSVLHWHKLASYESVAPGNPTLWRGVPIASIQKSFGSSGRDWKPWKKLPIPCKFCTYRFIRYSSTCYGKVRINPLMANVRNPDFSASPVTNVAWFVVVRPCYLNRDLLSGPKGN